MINNRLINNRIIKLVNRPFFSRREWVNLLKLYSVFNKDIKKRQEDILRKHCGIKPKRIFDPLTGQVNLKYDPKAIEQDYYL